MSDGFSYDVDIDALLNTLNGLGDFNLDTAVMAGGLVIEAQTKDNIIRYDFIDTGATLNSTEATLVGNGVAQIGPETEYAIFGEMGVGQSEKPFLRDALADTRQAVVDAIAAELRAQLARMGR